jgi:hypothetical protein
VGDEAAVCGVQLGLVNAEVRVRPRVRCRIISQLVTSATGAKCAVSSTVGMAAGVVLVAYNDGANASRRTAATAVL